MYTQPIKEALFQSFKFICSKYSNDKKILNKLAEYEVTEYCFPNAGYDLTLDVLVELFSALGQYYSTSNLINHFFSLDCFALPGFKANNYKIAKETLNEQKLTTCIYINDLHFTGKESTIGQIPSYNIACIFPQGKIDNLFLAIQYKGYLHIYELPLDDPNIKIIDHTYLDFALLKIHISKTWINKNKSIFKIKNTSDAAKVCLARLRLYQASMLVGFGKKFFEITKQYVNKREQFSTRLIANQAVRFKLSSLFCELKLAENSVACLAAMLDNNHDVSSTITFAENMLIANINLLHLIGPACMQLCGAFGMTKASGIEYYYRLYCVLINVISYTLCAEDARNVISTYQLEFMSVNIC